METKQLVEKYKEYIRERRRYFHQYPEISFEEVETTKRIAAELDKLGVDYEINTEKNTGLVAVIKGANPGKAVALRSDIDALSVLEANTFDFKSRTPGSMHACGHDAHIAILLGAARMLLEVREKINGTVYLVFQPAEEVGQGAPYMMRFGNWYQEVGAIYGSHVWSDLPTGYISVEPGERMAAGAVFTVKVKGVSGHAGQPQRTIDATIVAAAIVMNLQPIVSRFANPLDTVVLTIGSLQSGTRFNVISGEAVLEGTTRYFSEKVGVEVKEQMERIIMNTAAAYGATAEFEYELMIPATINDANVTKIAEGAAAKVFGSDKLMKMEKVMGGEDFAYYMQNKPGCYGFVGVRNEKVGAIYPHHSNNFNLDDDVLSLGAGVYAQFAIDWLEENK